MHDEVITSEGATLIPALTRFKDFYLVGGTALALQIGHRRSVDFDLFSAKPFSASLLERVKRAVAPHEITVTYRTEGQLNLLVRGVKITFFRFNYPVINSLLTYRGLAIASLLEIAAM